MNLPKFKPTLLLAAVVLASARCSFALDQLGLSSTFALPDRARNLVDSQDQYYEAVQHLLDMKAAVVRAREAAMRDAQCAPDYVAAVTAVDNTFHAFIDKKNALVSDLEKNNQVYSQMKAQATAVDAKIDAARLNPDTTPEQFEQLYKDRETFQKQWRQQENDAMDRAGITPLRQQWIDASKKLAELQDKLRGSIEADQKLKTAVANEEEARTAVQQARAAIKSGAAPVDVANNAQGSEQSGAADFLRKYSRTGFAGSDAWWTYGWSTISSGTKSAPAPTPPK
jgi:predicted nuclease with TOPRIM domain